MSGQLRIRRALSADAEQWNRFLEVCPDANFYQRYDWVRINAEHLGHDEVCLIAERAGELVGVLPVIRVRSRIFGDILTSMPFVNFGGPAAVDSDVETQLVDVACTEADRIGCDYVEIRSDRQLADLEVATHKVSMTIDLPRDSNELWAAFSHKHRQNVRRAYKAGVTATSGGAEFLDVFYAMMERGWRQLGTPLYSKRYFETVLETFGPDVRIFVAYCDGQPAAVAFNGLFHGVVEGMWAVSEPAFRAAQPMYVLYWEMIKCACESGYSKFHLGRSTVGSGGEQFKAKWKAYPTQLYWNYHPVRRKGLPTLNPENPRFRLAISVWQKLPLPITRLLGPRLARLIP